MTHIYLTTDEFEAETLIEDTNPGEEPKYKYQDISSTDGRNLEKRIGFNPMCSVECDETVSVNILEKIAGKLIKEGLFVATDYEGRIKNYAPKDKESREEMVRLALLSNTVGKMWELPCMALLRYSNNPNTIGEF